MKKIIILLTAVLLFPSCKEFLDQAPSGGQTKKYIFEDYTRAKGYMDQLYNYLPRTWASGDSYFTQGNPGFLESATDMAEYTATYGAANLSFNVGNWLAGAASREISQPWTNAYYALRIAYMFLENIDQFNNEPEGRKTLMQGEVHFMIAFNYFELLKRYGGVPLVKTVLDLESDMNIPRASYDETLEYIIQNLNLSLGEVPDEWPKNDFGRVTKATVMAMKSRVLLYAASPLNNPENNLEKWKAAAEAARDCIDYCDSRGEHQLYHEYGNLFMRGYTEERPEIIMPVNWGDNGVSFTSFTINYGQATPGEGFQGYGSNSPTQNFVDRFEVIKYDDQGNAIGTEKFDWNNPEHVKNIYKNRDPRFYYTVLYNNVFWINRKIETWREGNTYGKDINPKDHLFTRTGYYMRKFWPEECLGYNSTGSARLMPFYIRYGEILLNYAEAMNEVYGPDNDGLGRNSSMTARDAINRIRARLVCPPSNEINGNKNHPYYRIWKERSTNPDFPVLKKGMPALPSGLSQVEMRERIRNERSVELCFEGHYLYDVLRWKEGKDRIGGTVYGVDVIKNGETYTYRRKVVEERPFDENRMYRYPIPRTQVYIMGIEQNPGW